MQTIHLRVSDKVYKHLMWFLKKFSKEELQIIEENPAFSGAQQELNQELEQLENSKPEFLDLQQLDDDLEATIQRHEG